MANGNRPIAPVRKLIAAVLGTVAAFVVLFGLGMTSWAIVALGVALLVLTIALATVRGGGRTWVIGVGHVHHASDPPSAYAFGRCELQLVIDAPGLPPRSKKIIEPRVPVSKWPSVGQSLPLRVALDDQRHVRVLWDEVPTHAENAAAMATDLPPEYAGTEPLDDLLIHQEAPPWADRAPDDDFHDELREPPGPAPRLDPDPDPLSESREPVVMHQRPGGPVVLEGTLVEPFAGPLPRRATPAPRPPADERFDPTVPVETIDAGPPAAPFEPLSPVDPVDVPLDGPTAPDPEPTLDQHDLDEAIFGYDPEVEPADAAGPINGVGITLLVTDLGRSLEFYRDTLGFEEVDRGFGNAVLASGATRLVLREVSGAAPMSRRLVHVNLEVDDIQGAYDRLRESGLRFTYAPRVVNRGTKLDVWAAAFRDPDGHGIALTEWRTRADA
ncbi:VOC family protein [Micromonospora sp. DT233]|uniref:VOC family protein n=1 Tax=Micromonospora sp. DT233 TaxID=3393432 RepID=UPI003CFAC618